MKKSPKNRVKEKKTIQQARNKQQFPSISRIITDWRMLVLGVSVFLLTIAAVLGYQLLDKKNKLVELEKERAKIYREIEFWEKIVREYSDYRDAYFQLAILEYRLGNMEKARGYLDIVFSLDPNFEKGRELEKLLITTF